MNLDIGSLKLFLRVAATGAIGRAGEEFGYSPTAASQRIHKLEQMVGLKLLNRTTRAVSLSADGEIFLSHARKIINDIEDAVTDLQDSNKSIRGDLRVTASASFGRRYIAPFVGEFLQLHPEVSINLELSDGVIDIIQHGYDLALRIGTSDRSTLLTQKIADNPRVLVASPHYLATNGIPRTPAELADHNCIVLGTNRIWELKNPKGQTTAVTVHGSFATNYGEATTEAALGDIGIALKSKWDITEQLSSGQLIEVLEEYTVVPEWSVWAVCPPGQVVPARVRIFTEFIQHKLLSTLAKNEDKK